MPGGGTSRVQDKAALFQEAPKPSRNASKSPGRYGNTSLSPGRLAAARRVELAAVKAQAQQAGKLVSASPDDNEGSVSTTDHKENMTKISLPGRMGNRTVKMMTASHATSQADSSSYAAAAKPEEVKLDHLSSMLASGELQQAWGTAASSGSLD